MWYRAAVLVQQLAFCVAQGVAHGKSEQVIAYPATEPPGLGRVVQDDIQLDEITAIDQLVQIAEETDIENAVAYIRRFFIHGALRNPGGVAIRKTKISRSNANGHVTNVHYSL